MQLLVTCEHGGNRIPAKYWPLFKRHKAALESHRGFDPGALALARDVSKAFGAELVYSTTSRLLVELNRSRRHHQLFSEMTAPLPDEEREYLLKRYYQPYREWVEAQVKAATDKGERIVHLSCHSFTPALDGIVRRADIGLLYDPKRGAERAFCRDWQSKLGGNGALVVRRNYPYVGYSDGLTTHLRRRYPDPLYSGVEIEVNQKHTLGDPAVWRTLRKQIVSTLALALGSVS